MLSWKDPGHFVSEPVFVARPRHDGEVGDRLNQDDDESDESQEDDGVILFTLLGAASLHIVQLVILNAADLSEVARVSFHANGTVTEGFHGIFVADDQQWKY